MDFVDNNSLKLISGDNETFELPIAAAKLSKVIAEQIEGSPCPLHFHFDSPFFLFLIIFFFAEDISDQEFPVPNINAKTLFEVVKFLNHYQEEAMTKITKVPSLSLPSLLTLSSH
jgi:hypothetical protein